MTRSLQALFAASVLGWGLWWILSVFDIFASVPQFRLYVAALGLIVTGATLVLLIGKLFLNLIMGEVFQIEVTGLVRVLVYLALGFITGGIFLDLLGFDIRTLLTTSAVVGAAIALAMRRTLESIMSGMSLSSDPLLNKGSGILFDGRMMIIDKLTWRHVVARCGDKSYVLIPNSTLVDQPITVFPGDTSIEFEATVWLPATIPPQKVTDLLSDAFSDIEHLDASRPVMVAPAGLEPNEAGAIPYRLRLHARYFMQVDTLRGEVLRRAWYVLNRGGLFGSQESASDLDALVRLASPGMPAEMRAAVCADGRVYRFAPFEMLGFAASDAGRAMLILEGQAATAPDLYINLADYGPKAAAHLPDMVVDRLPKTALLRQVADRMAKQVGPIAEKLVREAIAHTESSDALIDRLSEYFPEGAARTRFREEINGLASVSGRRGPGAITQLDGDAVGRVMTDPELRAVTEVLAVTFPNKARSLKAAE